MFKTRLFPQQIFAAEDVLTKPSVMILQLKKTCAMNHFNLHKPTNCSVLAEIVWKLNIQFETGQLSLWIFFPLLLSIFEIKKCDFRRLITTSWGIFYWVLSLALNYFHNTVFPPKTFCIKVKLFINSHVTLTQDHLLFQRFLLTSTAWGGEARSKPGCQAVNPEHWDLPWRTSTVEWW